MEFSSLPALQEVAGDLDALMDRMARLHKMDTGPFPYADVRLIGKIVTSRKKLIRRLLKSVVPDLNLYFMEISGSCSCGVRAKTWPQEMRQQIAHYLQWDFFGRFPRYGPLRRWISDSRTPSLYHDLVLHNEMRLTLLAFLSLMGNGDTDDASADATED